MTFSEMIENLRNGKKIRFKDGSPCYCFVRPDEETGKPMIYGHNTEKNFTYPIYGWECIFEDGWSIYEEEKSID